MAVRYCTVSKYGTIRSNFKPKLRYVGSVRFTECALVRYVGTVRLTSRVLIRAGTKVFTPKKRYGTWSTVRFALILSSKVRYASTVRFKN